jgi:hypothetical protein
MGSGKGGCGYGPGAGFGLGGETGGRVGGVSAGGPGCSIKSALPEAAVLRGKKSAVLRKSSALRIPAKMPPVSQVTPPGVTPSGVTPSGVTSSGVAPSAAAVIAGRHTPPPHSPFCSPRVQPSPDRIEAGSNPISIESSLDRIESRSNRNSASAARQVGSHAPGPDTMGVYA